MPSLGPTLPDMVAGRRLESEGGGGGAKSGYGGWSIGGGGPLKGITTGPAEE